MKKIIAAAVAAAFVAPASYAADVTIGGELEYVYTSSDSTTDSVSDSDNLIRVQASEELGNGFSVVGTFQVINDTGATDLENDGTNIALSGPHGTLVVGDTSGAMDATGDYTDVSPSGGGFDGDGADHVFLWTLPTIVENLTLAVSHSPAGTNNVGADDSVVNDADAYSATYAFPNGAVYYASEEAAGVEKTALGIKYSMAGFTVAYENQETESTSQDITGVAVTYKYGNVDLGVEKQETKTPSSVSEDETLLFAQYNLGAVDLYVVSIDDETSTDNDQTRVGIEYNF